MVTPNDVGWGSYQEFEGPVWYGQGAPFRMPANPTESQRRLAVVTSTEGGSLSAVNMYDRAVISVGLIQLAESPYFLTSKLLGAIAERDLSLILPLQAALANSGTVFTKTPRGAWRFVFKDGRGEVDTAVEQQQLFLLHSDGKKGTWDDASRAHAKLWAASMANMLSQPAVIDVQVDYVANRLVSFAMPSAKALLFDDPAPSEGWTGALRAGFLSFAANNPKYAADHLAIAAKAAPGAKWSPEWCTAIFKELTFGPKIAIYPGRYDKIRPVMEKVYGVDLPDFATELAAWTTEMTQDDQTSNDAPNFFHIEEVQAFLISLGYDLGPGGADGKAGAKTAAAIAMFQRLNGLTPDGVLGPKTRAKMLEAWQAKH